MLHKVGNCRKCNQVEKTYKDEGYRMRGKTLKEDRKREEAIFYRGKSCAMGVVGKEGESSKKLRTQAGRKRAEGEERGEGGNIFVGRKAYF